MTLSTRLIYFTDFANFLPTRSPCQVINKPPIPLLIPTANPAPMFPSAATVLRSPCSPATSPLQSPPSRRENVLPPHELLDQNVSADNSKPAFFESSPISQPVLHQRPQLPPTTPRAASRSDPADEERPASAFSHMLPRLQFQNDLSLNLLASPTSLPRVEPRTNLQYPLLCCLIKLVLSYQTLVTFLN